MKKIILLIALIASRAHGLGPETQHTTKKTLLSTDIEQQELHLLVQEAVHRGIITKEVAEQIDPITAYKKPYKTAALTNNSNQLYYAAGSALAGMLLVISCYYLYKFYLNQETTQLEQLAAQEGAHLAQDTEQLVLSKKEQHILNAACTKLDNAISCPLLEKNAALVSTATNVALAIISPEAGLSAADQEILGEVTNIALDVATGNPLGAIIPVVDLATHPQEIEQVVSEIGAASSHVANQLSTAIQNTAHEITTSAHNTELALAQSTHASNETIALAAHNTVHAISNAVHNAEHTVAQATHASNIKLSLTAHATTQAVSEAAHNVAEELSTIFHHNKTALTRSISNNALEEGEIRE